MRKARRHRVVVAPDKFKGSLTAVEAAEAIAEGLTAGCPEIDVIVLPVADGGDGTVQAAIAAGYRASTITVRGPTGEPVQADIAIKGETAVVELAEASGLSRLPGGRPAALTASTYGTGELVRHALDVGARRIVLGIGGSATTDGGAGMVQALGARFLDADGRELVPGGAALLDLDHIDDTGLDPRLKEVDVVLASDVDNPLIGDRGAATVFGPQKGASADDVELLETALTHYCDVVQRDTGARIAAIPGGGAAGGAGAGAMAFLGARSTSGIGLVLDVIGFAQAVAGADLVVTGEGSLDAQSLAGKAPVGVANAASQSGVPVVALVGRLEVTPAELKSVGITCAHALLELEPDPAVAQRDAAALLRCLAERVGAGLAAGSEFTLS